ncbi:4'-phosphopantetheinyl transferase family protein [Micromonospora sp. DT81.3]|uniref:4'-phosphopantetheinyl transferase family protein n=1 Tax=Micromonospora sp. DT81.3 TaxID=3416523 RepID=UPI003CEA683E
MDVEQVAPIFDQPALTRRLCTPAELVTSAGMTSPTRREWLTQLWSMKESYAKALGTGLALNFTGFDAADLHILPGVRRVLTPLHPDRRVMLAISWVDAPPRIRRAPAGP